MSYLGDIESSFVDRIAGTLVSGVPLMGAVRGATGVFRPAMRAALLRERTPAAYVSVLDEATVAGTATARGPRCAVYAATRSLRLTSNPREGDAAEVGVFEVIGRLRGRLDYFEVIAGRKALGLTVKLLEGDERTAIAELLYRVETPTAGLMFDGSMLGGPASITTRGLRSPFVEPPGVPPANELIWSGEFRGVNDAAVDGSISAIEALIGAATTGELVDEAGTAWPGMRIVEWWEERPRFTDPHLNMVAQPAGMRFQQD